MFTKEFLRVSCLLTFYQIAFVHCGDLPMLGPADMNIKFILPCENPEQYSSYWLVEKRKLNRTHDIFNSEMYMDIDIDETVSISLNFEKWGDGGWKPNYLVINDSACHVLFGYMKHEWMNLMKLAGRPQKCPIVAGYSRWTNYIIDYRKMPQEVLYGEFKGRLYYIKDDVPKMCVEIFLTTSPKKIFSKRR